MTPTTLAIDQNTVPTDYCVATIQITFVTPITASAPHLITMVACSLHCTIITENLPTNLIFTFFHIGLTFITEIIKATWTVSHCNTILAVIFFTFTAP